jgi:hypothetical protein
MGSKMRGLVIALLLISALIWASFACAQTSIRPTDAMTPDEFKKCGLQKLTGVELEELNKWMAETWADPPQGIRSQAEDDEILLYDGEGKPVAYIAGSEESTIYTWSGRPVAYLDAENIYGFNGKQLGWFEDGRIYDHQGKIAGTTAGAAIVPLKLESFKGFKQFKPFKANLSHLSNQFIACLGHSYPCWCYCP